MAKWFLGALALVMASTIASTSVPQFDMTDYNCLVDNVYHEARGEGVEGMVAVAQVTVNRALKKSKTVCEIVYEPYQFSWTNGSTGVKSKRKATAPDRVTHLQSRLVAGAALGAWPGASHGLADFSKLPTKIQSAYFYHTKKVNPKWNKKMARAGVIGNHIFYKG